MIRSPAIPAAISRYDFDIEYEVTAKSARSAHNRGESRAGPTTFTSLSLSFALSLFSQLACARPKPVRNPESYDGAEGEFRAGDQPSYLYFDGANQRPGKRRDYDNHNGEK